MYARYIRLCTRTRTHTPAAAIFFVCVFETRSNSDGSLESLPFRTLWLMATCVVVRAITARACTRSRWCCVFIAFFRSRSVLSWPASRTYATEHSVSETNTAGETHVTMIPARGELSPGHAARQNVLRKTRSAQRRPRRDETVTIMTRSPPLVIRTTNRTICYEWFKISYRLPATGTNAAASFQWEFSSVIQSRNTRAL